jgi:hypothetical protein
MLYLPAIHPAATQWERLILLLENPRLVVGVQGDFLSAGFHKMWMKSQVTED